MAGYDPPAHQQILTAVLRLCRQRGNWRFTPHEVVHALPHIKESTVRTHVVSRCCVDAPTNHEHTLDYFRRIERGVYELVPAYRRRKAPAGASRLHEAGASYAPPAESVRDTVHAIVHRSENWYVGECLEVAVTTQGATLDELVANLREAVSLHLEGEDPGTTGVGSRPRISVTYELQD